MYFCVKPSLTPGRVPRSDRRWMNLQARWHFKDTLLSVTHEWWPAELEVGLKEKWVMVLTFELQCVRGKDVVLRYIYLTAGDGSSLLFRRIWTGFSRFRAVRETFSRVLRTSILHKPFWKIIIFIWAKIFLSHIPEGGESQIFWD